MKNLFALLTVVLLFSACDDGDIILTSFDFDDAPLELCGGPGSYVFFKINAASAESISLRLGTTDSLFFETDTLSFVLDGTTHFVNYRKYSGEITNAYFCNSIPPTSPEVAVNYLGASGDAILYTTAFKDDLDGLPVDVEEAQNDTDNDGLLNYFDADDEGDNVPTAAELDTQNADNDDNPLTNPLDTDGDGAPDYLDTDDDNDGVLTRYEDTNGDLDPRNDINDPEVGPNYLNPAVTLETVIDEYRLHSYDLTSDIRLVLSNVVLVGENEEIIQETLNMGEKADVVAVTILVYPPFIN